MMSALVLAAGEGKRLAGPKALAMLAGKSLIERVIRILAQSTVDEIVVACGARGDEVAAHAALWRRCDDVATSQDERSRLLSALSCATSRSRFNTSYSAEEVQVGLIGSSAPAGSRFS